MARGGLALAVAALATVAGCRAIAGYHDLTYGAAVTTCSAVTLPSLGNGRVRLVNVAAESGNTDFCVRAAGASDWGSPVFAETGPDCNAGLAYAQASVPFAVQPGKVDVKAIAPGETCGASATSEVDGVSVGDSVQGGAPVMTLMRYGGGSSTEAISPLPEVIRSTVPTSDTAVRVVNALSGGRSIVWGFALSATLPATIDPVIVTDPIAPGAATASSAVATAIATIASNGYAVFPPFAFSIAASYATDTTNDAITLFTPPVDDIATFYVIGDPNDAHDLHPVIGLYCDDAESPAHAVLATCTLARLPLLSVNMVNVSLYGAVAPFEAQRRPFVYADIAARTSDLVCVLDAYRLGDRTSIAAAAAAKSAQGEPGQFPYSFMVTTDLSTPPSDPADVRPAPANPPCGGSVNPTSVNNIYACAEANCSTVSGGDPQGSGVLNGTTQCLSADCTLQFGRLYSVITATSTPLQLANDYCFNCTLDYLLSETTIASGEASCKTQTSPPLSFDGQFPSVILSHYPIGATASYDFPTTGYRRGLLKAQIQLESSKTIDFFCGELTTAVSGAILPYTGGYGSDVLPDGGAGNGFEEEQDLQAREALAWIQQQVALDGVPAIIAIELNSDDPASMGATSEDGGLGSIAPEVIESFDAPASKLTPAVVPSTVPFCDTCPAPQNPYNGSSPPLELLHTYLSGFLENATQTETLWGTDNSEVSIPLNLPNQPAPPGGTGPVFEHYAHNYTILRP